MPKKRLVCFDYIAHIQRNDGTTVEISGRRASESAADVYDVLCKRAIALGGHLITQSINETDSTEESTVVVFQSKNVVVTPKKEQEDEPPVFHNKDIFGKFDKTYTGATAVIFRPRSKT